METKTLKQCKDYIRPLFKLCKRIMMLIQMTIRFFYDDLNILGKKKEVNYDILDRLYDIVQWCEDGNFMKASEEYLKCAIGT
jgi:pre-mRNA-splicing factor 18